tara:strand:- start:2613 stop:2828 length:216 start_codon:yes stop_codon:yes gene_type:complete
MDILRKKAKKVHGYYKEVRSLNNIEILSELGIRHAYGRTRTPFNSDTSERPELTDQMCIELIHTYIDKIHV